MVPVAVLIIMSVIIVPSTIAPVIMAPAVIAVTARTMPEIVTIGSTAADLAAAIPPVALMSIGRDRRSQRQHGEGRQ